ncbi:hypothetical protein TKK_0012624 [Trichogramma kaykai]|uniref:C2H2-type domain-containing protein n=1 Tax=Trichogramma kaykai TaxID=54128 RepID=A0ABD2WLI2_9HYME
MSMSSCSMDSKCSSGGSRKNSISLDKPLQMESSSGSTVSNKLQHKKQRQKSRLKRPVSKPPNAIQKPLAGPKIKRQIINKFQQSVHLDNRVCVVILKRLEIKKRKDSCTGVIDAKLEDALSTSDTKEINDMEIRNKTLEEPKVSTVADVSLLSKNSDPKITKYQAVVRVERCKLSNHIITQKSQVNRNRRFSTSQGHDKSETFSNNKSLNKNIQGELCSKSGSHNERRTRSVEKFNSSNKEIRNERSISVSEHVMNSNILNNGEVNCGDVDTKKLKNNVESVNNCSVLSTNVSVSKNFDTNNEESKTECPHSDKKINNSKPFDKNNRLLNSCISGNRTTRQTILNNKTNIDDQSTVSSLNSSVSNEPEKQTTLNVIANKVQRLKKFIQKKFKQDDQKEKCDTFHNSDCSQNLEIKEQVDNTTDGSLKNISFEQIDNAKSSTITENHRPQADSCQDNSDEKQQVTLKIFDPSLNVPALLTNIHSEIEESKGDESATDNFLSDSINEKESEESSAVIVENKIITRRHSAEIINNQQEKNSEIGVSENVVKDNSFTKDDKIDNLSESNGDLAKSDCKIFADDSLPNDSIEKMKIVTEQQKVPLVKNIETAEPKISPKKRGRPPRLNNVANTLKINIKSGDNEIIKTFEKNAIENDRTKSITENNEANKSTSVNTSENIVKVVKKRGRPPSLHKLKLLNNTLNKSSDDSVTPKKRGRKKKIFASSNLDNSCKSESENESLINKNSNTLPIGVDTDKPKRRGRKPKHLLEYESSHLSDSTSTEQAEDTEPEKVVKKKRGRKPWKHLIAKNKDDRTNTIKPNGIRKIKNGFVVKKLQNHLKLVNGVVFPKRRGRKPQWLKDQEARLRELQETNKAPSADDSKTRYVGEAPQLQALPEKGGKKLKQLKNWKLSKYNKIYKNKLVPIADNVNIVKRKRGRPPKNPGPPSPSSAPPAPIILAPGERPVLKLPPYLQKLADYRDRQLKKQEQQRERERAKLAKKQKKIADSRPEGAFESAFLNFLRTQREEREDDDESDDDSDDDSDATANSQQSHRFRTNGRRYDTDDMINNDVSECVEDLVTTVAGDQAEMARRQDRINKITFPSEIVTSTHVSDIFAETAIILEKMGPDTSESMTNSEDSAAQEVVKDRHHKLLLGLKKKCEENLTKRQEQDDAYNSGMSDDTDSDQNLADRLTTLGQEDGVDAVSPLVQDHERNFDDKLSKSVDLSKLREHRIVMRISRTSDNMHIIAPSNISLVPMRDEIEADEEEENLIAIDPSQLYPDQLPPTVNGDLNKFIGNDLNSVQPLKEVKITPKGSDHGYGSSNRVPSESPASSSGGNSSTRLADIDESLKPRKRGRPRKYPIFTESELMAKQMAAAASSAMSSTTVVSQQQQVPPQHLQQQQQQQQQPTLIGPAQIVFTVSPAPNTSDPPPLVPIESSAQILFNGAARLPSPGRDQPLFEPVESIVVQPKSTKISSATTEALKAFRKRKREDPTAAASSTTTTSTSASSATTSSSNPNVPSILAEFVKTRQNALANEISTNERMNGELHTATFDQQADKRRRLSEGSEDSNKYGITKELVVQLRKIDETDQLQQAAVVAPQPRPKGKPRILHEEHYKPPMDHYKLALEHNNNHRKNGQTSNVVLSHALPINPQLLSSESPQAQAMSAAKAPAQPLLMVVPPTQSVQQQQVAGPVQATAQVQAQAQGLPPPQQFCILFIPDTMYNSETSLSKDAQPTATLVNFQPVPDAEMPTANKQQLIFNSPTPTTPTIGMNGFINSAPTKVAKSLEQTTSPTKGSYTCNICVELVEVLSRLESDLSMEEDKTNICCPYCSITCHPMIRMEHHLTQEHLRCENDQQCQYSIGSRARMAQHNLSPDRTTYFQASLKCRSCYLVHGSVQELNEHVKQKHKILVRFNNGFNRHLLMQCPADCVCRVGLRQGASSQQRQAMIKRCPNAMRRLEKVESAGYEVYSCTICQNTYMHKMEVIEHLQTTHTVACKFTCPRCLFCFRTRHLLDVHQCCGITIAGKEKLLNVAILPVNVAAAVQEQDKELEQLQAAAAAAAAASSGKNGMRRRNGVNGQVLEAAKRPKIINMIGGKHRKRACPKCQKRIAYRKSLHDHIADHLAHVEKGPRVLALELLKMYIDGLTDMPRLEELRKMLMGHYDNDGMSLVEIVTIEEEELTPEEKIALEREEAREAAAVANIQSGREETVECSKCRSSFKRPVSIDPYIRSSLRQLPDPLCEVCDPLPKTRGRKAAALNSSQQQQHQSLSNSPTTTDNGPYACGGCTEQFTSATDMEAHCRLTFHSTAHTIYVCEQCKRCFSTSETLELHKASHETTETSSSEIIAAVESIADHEDQSAASVSLNREDSLNDLSKLQDLSDNRESQEEDFKLLECFICHELCSSSVSLKNHLKREHGRKAFICLCCNELIVDVTEIRHMIDAHIKSNFKSHLMFDDKTEEQAQQQLEAQLLSNVTSEEEVTPKDVEELVQLLGKERLQSLMVYHDFEGKSCNAVMCCHICPNYLASRDTCRYHYVWEHDITCLLCDEEFRVKESGYQHKVTKHTSISGYLWCIQRLCSSIVMGLNLDPSLPSHSLAQMVLSKVNFMDVNAPFSEINLLPTTMDLTSDKSDTVSESLVVLSEDQLPDSGNVIEVTVGRDESDDELLNMLSLSPNYETCTNNRGIENPMVDQIQATPPQTPIPTAQVPSSPLVDTYLSTGVCKYKPANGTGEESEVLVVTDEDLVKYKNDIDALCSRICNEHATFGWLETRELLTKYFREKERETLAKLAAPIDSTNNIITESSLSLTETDQVLTINNKVIR